MHAEITPVRSRLKRVQARRPGERLSAPLRVEDATGFSTVSSVTSSGAAADVGGVMVLLAHGKV
ncbi:hypothetical protein GCM10022232_03810 [Streptomyces plumbiresistens]|uniref:Uncharacterized protein n=1 Tax=Streptomyces plumbiresistens TaxID=511811 RepID=A0ABP7Q356_9ACTN